MPTIAATALWACYRIDSERCASSLQTLLHKRARGRDQKTANFCAGLLEEHNALWAFCEVRDLQIPITNNPADRALWPRGRSPFANHLNAYGCSATNGARRQAQSGRADEWVASVDIL
jgi:hypothetical protein